MGSRAQCLNNKHALSSTTIASSLLQGQRSEAGFLDDRRLICSSSVHVNELCEAFVLGLDMEETVVDLLYDAVEAKQVVVVLGVEILDLEAQALCGAIGDLAEG